MRFVNPKVGPRSDPVDAWYRYYAGYSAGFVKHALAETAPAAVTVLDPWNGTGTTTVVAASQQIASVGVDVNPALVIVARARLLGAGVWASIGPLCEDVIAHSAAEPMADDPLRFWFTDPAAAHLRGLQVSLQRLLVDSAASRPASIGRAAEMSTLAAFFYTVLFRTVRVLIAPRAVSNPTWWKRVPEADRLDPTWDTVVAQYRASVAELAGGLHRTHFDGGVDTTVTVGDSRKLALDDDSVDAVVSSPPYCTRIDYGVATRPELAVLGADESQIRSLRNLMVGTPTMTGRTGDVADWGPLAADFLARVAAHASRASATYYSLYLNQYYAGMWSSLAELRRVTRAGAPVVLVVQDSYYKDLHNDTPGILLQMADRAGFTDCARHNFRIPRTRASMNPKARQHRDRATATESVLILR